MDSENTRKLLGKGINYIILDDTFIDKSLNTSIYDNKFPIGSILLQPKSVEEYTDYNMYFVDPNGKIHCTSGASGTNGNDGLSAYQIAQEHGFEGEEDAWLESLKGEDGEDIYTILKNNGYSDFSSNKMWDDLVKILNKAEDLLRLVENN